MKNWPKYSLNAGIIIIAPLLISTILYMTFGLNFLACYVLLFIAISCAIKVGTTKYFDALISWPMLIGSCLALLVMFFGDYVVPELKPFTAKARDGVMVSIAKHITKTAGVTKPQMRTMNDLEKYEQEAILPQVAELNKKGLFKKGAELQARWLKEKIETIQILEGEPKTETKPPPPVAVKSSQPVAIYTGKTELDPSEKSSWFYGEFGTKVAWSNDGNFKVCYRDGVCTNPSEFRNTTAPFRFENIGTEKVTIYTNVTQSKG